MKRQNLNTDERRQVILKGIRLDRSITKIAAELGVRRWTVLNEIRVMRHANDPELKLAYNEKEESTRISTQHKINKRNERFLKMTGMTFQEKNFLNMLNFYKSELKSVHKPDDENRIITSLSTNIRKTLRRNSIITNVGGKTRLTEMARNYLDLNSVDN